MYEKANSASMQLERFFECEMSERISERSSGYSSTQCITLSLVDLLPHADVSHSVWMNLWHALVDSKGSLNEQSVGRHCESNEFLEKALTSPVLCQSLNVDGHENQLSSAVDAMAPSVSAASVQTDALSAETTSVSVGTDWSDFVKLGGHLLRNMHDTALRAAQASGVSTGVNTDATVCFDVAEPVWSLKLFTVVERVAAVVPQLLDALVQPYVEIVDFVQVAGDRQSKLREATMHGQIHFDSATQECEEHLWNLRHGRSMVEVLNELAGSLNKAPNYQPALRRLPDFLSVFRSNTEKLIDQLLHLDGITVSRFMAEMRNKFQPLPPRVWCFYEDLNSTYQDKPI